MPGQKEIGTKLTFDNSQFLPAFQAIIDKYTELADLQDSIQNKIEDGSISETEALLKLTKGYKDLSNVVADAADAQGQLFQTNQKAEKQVRALVNQQKEHAQIMKDQADLQGYWGRQIDKAKDKVNSFVKALQREDRQQKGMNTGRNQAIRDYIHLRDAAKNAASQITILGTNVGQIVHTFKLSRLAVGALIKVMGGLKVAIASTGIGLLVLALGSLVTFLTKTQRGMDMMQRKMGAVKAGANVLIDRFGEVGRAILQAFSDPKGALKTFRNALRGIFKEIGEEAKAMDQLIKKQQELRDLEQDIRRERSKNRTEIERLRKIARDSSEPYEKRKQAILEAFELEKETIDKTVDLDNQRLEILKKQMELRKTEDPNYKNRIQDEEELTRLMEKRDSSVRESLDKQSDMQGRLNQLYKEEQRRLQMIQEKYDKFTETLKEQLLGVELGSIKDPVEKIMREAEEAAKKLAEQRDAHLKAAIEAGASEEDQAKIIEKYTDLLRAVGDAASKEMNLIFEKLRREAEMNNPVEILMTEGAKVLMENELFQRASAAAGTEAGKTFGEQWSESFKKLAMRATDPGGEVAGQIANSMTELAGKSKKSIGEIFGDVNDFFSDLGTGIDDWLGDPKTQEMTFAIKDTVGAVTDIIVGNVDKEIDAIDELIDKHDEKISRLHTDLEREQELADAGLANNLGRVQEELDAENAKREEALEKRQELEKKAAIAKVINDTIQQSTTLASAAANIFEAFSRIPFVGVPLAIAAIGTMFAAFAKAKVDAVKAAEPKAKLNTGAAHVGEAIGHRTDRGGSAGYAIVDPLTNTDTGVRISGQEVLMGEAVSNKYRLFLDDLNKNPDKYKHFDFDQLMANPDAYSLSVPDMNLIGQDAGNYTIQYEQKKDDNLESMLKELVSKQNKGLRQALESQENVQYLVGEPKFKIKTKGNKTSKIRIR